MNDPNQDLRDEFEGRLARILGRLLARQRKRVLAYLDIKANGIPPTFWEGEKDEWRDELFPELMAYAEAAAERLLVGHDPQLERARQGLIAWSTQHTGELINDISDFSREVLTQAIQQFSTTPGFTTGDLRDTLEQIWDPVRAQRIAVTEVTRAFSEGQRAAVNELADIGIEMRSVWHTRGGGCEEICAPLDGTDVTGKDWPPAHPNCGCSVDHELA